MIISFYYFELTDSVKLFDRPPYGRRLVNILPLYCKEIDIDLCVTCKKKSHFNCLHKSDEANLLSNWKNGGSRINTLSLYYNKYELTSLHTFKGWSERVCLTTITDDLSVSVGYADIWLDGSAPHALSQVSVWHRRVWGHALCHCRKRLADQRVPGYSYVLWHKVNSLTQNQTPHMSSIPA